MEIKSNDKNTFDALYDANMEKVYQVARYYSENHHTAQDITQIVFMKLYTNMDNINEDNVEAWLKTTAKHMALNYKRECERSFRQDDLTEDFTSEIDNVIYLESLEDILVKRIGACARADLVEKIYADLYEKNERWYEAITITYILEKPQKEVAETMGVSLSVLQMILYRAKKWIRKRYQEQFERLDKE